MKAFLQIAVFAALHAMFMASPWNGWAPDFTLVALLSARGRLGRHLAPRALLAVLLGCWLDAWSAAPWGLQIAIVVAQVVILFLMESFLDRGRIWGLAVALTLSAMVRWLLQFGVAAPWLNEVYATFWAPAISAVLVTLLLGLVWSLRVVIKTESSKSLLRLSGR